MWSLIVAMLALAIALPAAGQPPADEASSRWEKDIAAFDAADEQSPPPKGEIVFVGSSTIRLWDTRASFPDLTIINRGFGGSEMADLLRYVDRLVIRYEPRIVVVYAGDNDIGGGDLSEQVAVEFERFVRAVHARLPQTRIVYIGIKPSLLRWSQIDRMRMTNNIVRAFCARDDRLAFLDVDNVMLGWDEKPRRELYAADGLHLSAEGYRLWSTLLRPFLVSGPPAHGGP
ncbi:MAG TPA: GDSL-type esterase/lipase family protein [Vicinamibacterales bacterium]|nr:GDSL-type esterase/lipase family protein [Vicinamibacterales bacterium]